MRILIVDNYDSFTFNLFQLVACVAEAEPVVVRNDQLGLEQLREIDPDCVILSPGPGRPEVQRDFGIGSEVLATPDLPILGVCLGHQGIAHAFGGRVVHAPAPMHGRISRFSHDGSDLFRGIPASFDVVRYHSLVVAEPLPRELEVIGRSDDGLVMALRHRTRPIWGVQFHPESVCSEYGDRIVANFASMAQRARGSVGRWTPSKSRLSVVPAAISERALEPRVECHMRTLPFAVDAEAAFVTHYGDAEAAFWLDSSLREAGRARFSYFGAAGGPLSQIVTSSTASGELTVEKAGEVVTLEMSVFDYLERELAAHAIQPPEELPFGFVGGFVGYLGYESRADAPRSAAGLEGADARLLFADRFVVVDHVGDRTHIVAVSALDGEARVDAAAWLEAMTVKLSSVVALSTEPPARRRLSELRWQRPRARYLDDIAACMRHIQDGETYEVCLTNQIVADTDIEPLAYYRSLRKANPAPQSAFLCFGDFAIASSSPERFLRVDALGSVEAKPIKGTAARASDPHEDARVAEHLRTSEKTRSENLMIADLLRNDLGSVCVVGTVVAAELMHVESYATVHQLVTTVRGQLRSGISPVACVRACFPGGSMTGAPKHRTMQIIDELEKAPRGAYSGAIGYFSLDKTTDLNIVIRTAVFRGGEVRIGVGGAIVALSDPDEEFDEIVLKARALIRTLAHVADPSRDADASLAEIEGRLRS
jgi:para-aminobenzoate synthetase